MPNPRLSIAGRRKLVVIAILALTSTSCLKHDKSNLSGDSPTVPVPSILVQISTHFTAKTAVVGTAIQLSITGTDQYGKSTAPGTVSVGILGSASLASQGGSYIITGTAAGPVLVNVQAGTLTTGFITRQDTLTITDH